MDLDFMRSLVKRDVSSKIVLMVLDGLGGLPVERSGFQTALEAAATPNLDKLASQGACGLHVPVGAGITPGSGPSHLALFGYDPLRYQVGRGVLSALGIGFDLQPGDVAARGNFCTLDDAGRVSDRRAGRIASEKGRELCEYLRERVDLSGAHAFIQHVKEYRLLLVLRGEDGDPLNGALFNTDPLEAGEKPRPAEARVPEAKPTAKLVRNFVDQVAEALDGQEPANMVLLRGFSQLPQWPTVQETFGLRAAAIAMYPMYRGVARLVGMEALPIVDTVEDEVDLLRERWNDFDFFFVHIKRIDSAGEDGDFDEKVARIEEADGLLPAIFDLEPDVLVVTGDHSTPAAMSYHSWHPVPAVLWSRYCRPDAVTRFSERACVAGGLGARFPAFDLMPLALAHAGRLEKFGA